MENNLLVALFAVLILLAVGVGYFTMQQETQVSEQKNVVRASNDFVGTLLTLPKEPLTDDEIKALIEMRQEEKLARDVYLSLYEKWKLQIFRNIARSEQMHTDAVKTLLEKYNIPDPIEDNSIGVYKDEKFAQLYNQLVTKGSASIVDALKVGATVEDLDTKDLENWLSKNTIDNDDIRVLFCNLTRGSRNHLRAFVSQLEAYGATYVPQYISSAKYNAILSRGMETGHYLCS